MTPEQKKKNSKITNLHKKMRKIIPRPQECQICNEAKNKLHLANINHTYNENNPKEWIYVCYKGKNNCHAILDGKTLTNNTKEYYKQYKQSEKGKATIKKYNQSEKGKATIKKYNQSEKGKAKQKEYNQSKKGKAKQKEYNQSEKRKASNKTKCKQYRESEKGKATRKQWKLKNREKNLAKQKEYYEKNRRQKIMQK